MKCTKCNTDMKAGKLYGDRYSMKWLPNDRKLLIGIWAIGGIQIGKSNFPLGGRSRAQAHRCENCKLLVIENDGM